MFLAEQYTRTSRQVFGKDLRDAYRKKVNFHDGDVTYTGCLGENFNILGGGIFVHCKKKVDTNRCLTYLVTYLLTYLLACLHACLLT